MRSLARRFAPGLIGLLLVAHAADARADEAIPAYACPLKGTNAMPKGVTIYDAPVGGKPIASFTGAALGVTAFEVPQDINAARARIATSVAGAPSLRIEGYVKITELPLFTAIDVPVYTGHLWITAGQEVTVTRASGSGLSVEHTIMGSESQKLSATASCEAFSFAPVVAAPMEPEGNARGYTMKGSTLELLDAPKGDVVLSLSMIEGASQLFWSTEQKLGFVHVVTKGDVVIDAWAKWNQLSAMKKGELMDQLIPPRRVVSGAQLGFGDSPPRIAKFAKDTVVRATRNELAARAGIIEAGAEVYVLETVVGYTNVLPKNLALLPGENGGFWVAAADVPAP